MFTLWPNPKNRRNTTLAFVRRRSRILVGLYIPVGLLLYYFTRLTDSRYAVLVGELVCVCVCVGSVEVRQAAAMFDRMLETLSVSDTVTMFTQSVCM